MYRTLYKVFIGSPQDTNHEREIISEVILDLNKDHGQQYNFLLETVKWEDDSFPDIGADAQDVINHQLDDYDIFIGLISQKFGSPTIRYQSGTVEEFEIAFDKYSENPNKNAILFYFKNDIIKYLDIDIHQAIQVHRFKERIEELGVFYSTFETEVQFRKLINKHLLKTIHKLQSIDDHFPDQPEVTQRTEKIIQYKPWAITTKKSTPQWANFYEIDIRPYNFLTYKFGCNFTSKSNYIRFGFKIIHPKGKMFGDGNIQSKDENILYHIGKNLSNNELFSTMYENGIRTRKNKPLFDYTGNNISLLITRDTNNLFRFFINRELDEEVYVSSNLSGRIILMMWGDENEYEGNVTNMNIELLS